MKEHTPDSGQSPFEARSRELFRESVDAMDMRLRSRLTQARHAALDAAAAAKRRPWLLRIGTWTPAAGVTAAALLGAVLWFGFPAGNHGLTAADSQPSLKIRIDQKNSGKQKIVLTVGRVETKKD